MLPLSSRATCTGALAHDEPEAPWTFVACVDVLSRWLQDPRNLLVGFELAAVIARRCERARGARVSELCDVLLCYFPITFRPPQNDKVCAVTPMTT